MNTGTSPTRTIPGQAPTSTVGRGKAVVRDEAPEVEFWQDRLARVDFGDSLAHYASWPKPKAIVSDGGYGVLGFEGDTSDHLGLPEWYEPHIAAWSRHATPATTLWFWNSEIGWAAVHPILEKYGWRGPRSFKHPSAPTRTLPHPLAGSRSVPDLPVRRHLYGSLHVTTAAARTSAGLRVSELTRRVVGWRPLRGPLSRRTTADPTADRLARRGPSPRGLPAPQATPAPHGRRRVAVPPDAWSLRNAGTAADRGRTSSGTATPTAATGSGAGRPETPWGGGRPGDATAMLAPARHGSAPCADGAAAPATRAVPPAPPARTAKPPSRPASGSEATPSPGPTRRTSSATAPPQDVARTGTDAPNPPGPNLEPASPRGGSSNPGAPRTPSVGARTGRPHQARTLTQPQPRHLPPPALP